MKDNRSDIPFEAEVAEGLEAIAAQELNERFQGKITYLTGRLDPVPGALQFRFSGDPTALDELRTVKAVYAWRHFDIPRPKALLGDQNLRSVLDLVGAVLDLAGRERFRSFYLSAAGSDSTVLTRFKQKLESETGLPAAAKEGDLWLRLRRPLDGTTGWDLLVRLTPRPLSTRSWRVCNLEGALNAAVAHAMVRLSAPSPGDTYLNIACGSGTLLVERLALAGAQHPIGVDIDQAALACAAQNLAASGYKDHVQLMAGDGRCLPIIENQVDAICGDLPFGQLMGSHVQNLELYPAILDECARVLRTGGRCVLITHEVRLMDSLVSPGIWSLEQKITVSLSGLHPRIYVLRKHA